MYLAAAQHWYCARSDRVISISRTLLRYYWLLLINHPVRLPSLKTSLSNNRDSCELDHGAFIIVEGQMRHVRSMVLHL
jgi:hypothetical protein